MIESSLQCRVFLFLGLELLQARLLAGARGFYGYFEVLRDL